MKEQAKHLEDIAPFLIYMFSLVFFPTGFFQNLCLKYFSDGDWFLHIFFLSRFAKSGAGLFPLTLGAP